ncbi:anthranilate phosphoribosyltransferase [Peptoclostridium litorale DSM 5388]|uniref:Anthranilate phosphoribosyltransferase n=1 Tax=Peptoclostridium litorale DSM 5388 TaxID=1121324 RepID=A0A069RNU8_PEPLI|nr:anthranilate phosphoribosyltransferase [Peptoclostridium litorale]KDR95857.1 anthranilate phosphoribosyltransferase TrpD [Peptoclostridium litorale DSM 5388]SIO11255.1 anthranilate phosphoribosyltransferase [Peptoclostridium litorale DSM 5388]
MIKVAIEKLVLGEDLEHDQMVQVMEEIMEGRAPGAQIGAFLTALKIKGETADEISAGAQVMREKSLKVDIGGQYAIDTCGTGGDALGTFNVSTAVMFIAAAAGVTVLKHGNRSVSSRCGSADVLESLGVKVDLGPEGVRKCAMELGLGFMFAPIFHSAMKNVMGVRRELGMRTIFNMLGPLSNPAKVQGQVLGVFERGLTQTFAEALRDMGCERALVVHGDDGLDEISITTSTHVSELKGGKIKSYTISPEDFGMELSGIEDIQGGDADKNAQIIKDILSGKRGAKRDIVLLNAGAAIYVGKKAGSMGEGVEIAKDVIDKGLALEKLQKFAKLTRRLRQ